MAYPSELALFNDPKVPVTHQKVQFVEYRPTSQLNSGALQFTIDPSANQYIDLKRTKLHIKVKITKADGSALGTQDRVAPINLVLHSLFSQIDVQLQQELVTGSASQSYPYKAYLETLL